MRYVISRHQNNNAEAIAETREELQAINALTDAVYNALLDKENINLIVTCRDAENVSSFARVSIDMHLERTQDTFELSSGE
jgi:hypothetical protein